MKTKEQVISFLTSQPIKPRNEKERILSICKAEGISFHAHKKLSYSKTGLSSADFIDWLDKGFASGDVARLGHYLVIVGRCKYKLIKSYFIYRDGEFSEIKDQLHHSELEKVSDEERDEIYVILAKKKQEYSVSSFKIIQKYIPTKNDRVEFESKDKRGVGVVKSVNECSGEITLYCYYIYDDNIIGFSMEERNICNLHSFNFSPMSVSANRRLNKELEKHGKVWLDKLHRIESVNARVEIGEKYYFITDTFTIGSNIEKGANKSLVRYRVGNYFKTREECSDFLEEVINSCAKFQALPLSCEV